MSVLELQRISAEFPPQDKHTLLSIRQSIILSDILFLFARDNEECIMIAESLREAPRNISKKPDRVGTKIERIKRNFRIARQIFGFQIHTVEGSRL